EELARSIDDRARLGRITYRMGAYSWMNAQYADAIHCSERAAATAAALGDAELRLAAAHVAGIAHEAQGNYQAAIEHLRSIVDGPDAELGKRRRSSIPTYVAACAWLAILMAHVGNFAAGRAYGDRGVEAAMVL